MRSVQFDRFGGPEVLKLVESDTPAPGPGEALIRVHAAGINFAETLMRENRYAMTPELPTVLGSEAAGVIVRTGSGVREFEPGMRVAAPLFATGRYSGGYADHVLVDAGILVPLPDAVPFDVATALMTQGLTALYLTRQIPPRGKVVLVNAAAGGVGSLLVQLAKHSGATKVIAAASTPDKIELARQLGADFCVNYTDTQWVEKVRDLTGGVGPDVIYESVGGKITRECLQLLAPQGEMVIYGALNIQEFQLGIPELVSVIFRNQSLTGFALPTLLTATGLQTGLAELFGLTASGRLKVTMGGTYPLTQAAEAHRALEGRRTMGKLVLVP